MIKGTMSIEDAQLVGEFAQAVQPILRQRDYNRLLETAETVGRIVYCTIAEARQNTRAERARKHFTEPYTKVIE
jgi:hypothetical protein